MRYGREVLINIRIVSFIYVSYTNTTHTSLNKYDDIIMHLSSS